MGVLRTFLILAVLGAAPAAALPLSVPHSAGARAEAFAICTGSWRAEAEHRALFGGPATDEAEARHAAFADLLDAVAPDALDDGVPAPRLRALLVEARLAHRALRAEARFGAEAARRAPADLAASHRLERCDALLLGA
jgi:hypothetical protein